MKLRKLSSIGDQRQRVLSNCSIPIRKSVASYPHG